MKNEVAQENYRKLIYFFENKIKVHFKDLDEIFYNGEIIELNDEKLTMILRERIRGTMPILLEFVKPDSIVKMTEVGGLK